MSSYIDDLNYIIHKARIGLTSVNLIKTSNLYNQIIDENIVEKIADALDNLSKKQFDDIEQVRNLVAKDDLAFMSQVDNIIYKLTNGENVSDIKNDIVKNAALFPSVADDMHHVWQTKYDIQTILDDPIDRLYHTSSDQEFLNQVNYALNKANSSLSLYASSQNIIDEISLAEKAELADKQAYLDLAKNNKEQFIQTYDLFKVGYANESIIDDFIIPPTDSKLEELFSKVAIAGEIQASLMSDGTV